ncbi:MAG: hypothetical protein HYU80_01895 [Candidatus Blackburnbacteria bacterium]|nr:hypothetical protein [Candidatus Blackburnbacteria bacterium]
MVKSGWVYSFGMGFWGPNGHDGVWHLALINHLAKNSFQMPVFAGEVLKNYHIGFDLLLALIYKLTRVPVNILYFQLIPVFIAVSTGVLTYKFTYFWRKSNIQAFWATFFVYFGGSFGPFVTLARSGEIGGESMFWAQQSISTLLNPSFALSFILLLAGLFILLKYESQRTSKLLFLAVVVFGILGQVKVYAGILSLGALFMAGVFQFLKDKRFEYLKVFVGSSVFFVLLFIPLNRSSSSLVVFQPFWFLETMMAVSDRFSWPKFYEAMINYRFGNIWYKAFPAYVIAFLIFWIGNMGTRLINVFAVLEWVKNPKKLLPIEIFVLTVIVAGVIFPMLFLQRGTPWNTIQFFYYSLMLSGILAGIAFGNWVDKKSSSVRKASIVLLLVLTLPTTYATLKHYLPSRPPAKLSQGELEALNFLRKQKDGVVLTYPFDSHASSEAVSNPPRPLYLYESTAYVAAFSGKSVFLEDEVNLNITGYDWRSRREQTETFLESLDQGEVRKFLGENDIRYIYWIGKQRARLGETQLGITQIFENKEVKIYQVN